MDIKAILANPANWCFGVAVGAFLGLWWGEDMTPPRTNITVGVMVVFAALGVALKTEQEPALVRLLWTCLAVGFVGLFGYYQFWKQPAVDTVVALSQQVERADSGSAQRDAELAKQMEQLGVLLRGQSPGLVDADAREQQLLSKYPDGYIIYSVDRSSQVIPRETRLRSHLIDSRAVATTDRGTSLQIHLPDITLDALPGRGRFEFGSNITIVPRQTGVRQMLGSFKDVGIWVEVLAAPSDGPAVVLVGFGPDS